MLPDFQNIIDHTKTTIKIKRTGIETDKALKKILTTEKSQLRK